MCGVAAKTYLLGLERAQRAVLKIIYDQESVPATGFPPHIDSLKLKSLLLASSIYLPNSIQKNNGMFPYPTQKKHSKSFIPRRTSFAKHQFNSLGSKLYNIVKKDDDDMI